MGFFSALQHRTFGGWFAYKAYRLRTGRHATKGRNAWGIIPIRTLIGVCAPAYSRTDTQLWGTAMADIRVIEKGTIVGRNGAYWQVETDNGRASVYEQNMKIEAPCEGEVVVLTHEYGRSGLIVTCCRSATDPDVLDAGSGV